MRFSVCHGYEELSLGKRENYSNLQLNLSEARQYHEETDNLLKPFPYSSEINANTSRPKFGTKKKSWTKYLSYLSNKFTKQSKISSQKKQAFYSFTWKSKLVPKFGTATGIACKLASIQEAIRKRASRSPFILSFNPTKEEEIEVPYIQLEKLGYCALRREAFGPIYMVT